MAPYEGTAVFELNTTLMFTLLELLTGSKGKTQTSVQRKITDIEKSIMQTLMRVVLRDLGDAWASVAEVNFAVQSLASEPQLTHVLAPAEAVIVIAVDVRVGSVSGLMNLAIPSIFIKRLRHKFDQLQTVRKTQVTVSDQSRTAELIQDVEVRFHAELDGGAITAMELLDLTPGDILVFDHPIDRPLKSAVNDQEKWAGFIISKRGKVLFQVDSLLGSNPV
jgi:flagellar motor switch protein FliM